MLLFSTILNINSTMTKEKFIELVIQWNKESPHPENIIEGLEWNGEKNIRYGNEQLWLDIEEYRNENIIAVRYEKSEQDGVIWNSDYIMNFNEMKLSIQLDRSFKEDALEINPEFSTPHFITTLIDNGYLKQDNEIPILRIPIIINEEKVEYLSEIINENKKCCLPVVYVSKTVYNTNPINVNWLANRLKGVAHVLVQEHKELNSKIRVLCHDQNEYNGGIGIYYPKSFARHRSFHYRKYNGYDEVLLNKVVVNIIQYENSQMIHSLYTWQGVINAILNDKLISQKEQKAAAESAKEKAEQEVDNVYSIFDEDIEKLQKQIKDLTKENELLRCENQGIRTKLESVEKVPVLFLGEEDDFYPGEVKDTILYALQEMLKKISYHSRETDIIRDILEKNNYEHLVENKKNIIKRKLKTYNGMSAPLRQELKDLGFEITEEGKHYKLTYYGDDRYWTTLGKTPGDGRNGKNIVSEITNML